MSTSQLNPAQHVERIREIIMGRDLNQVHGRLQRIENGLDTGATLRSSDDLHQLQQSFSELQEECHQLRLELHQEKIMRKQHMAQLDQQLRNRITSPVSSGAVEDPEDLAAQMAARIDARFREMMSHLQTELLQWKGQLDRDVQAIREVKMDRKEVLQRFAKIVSAAMEDADEPPTKDGYLL
ncbi:hypothetical protein N9Z02_01095 [Akkermansiaceae bacterium]|nr:hypothetical protein [Akkermansiaceae bacterium]